MSRALSAAIGVVENANTGTLVTISGGKLLDRREVVLTPLGTPTHPHHHEGAWAMGRYLNTPRARRMPMAEAVGLVAHVRTLAEEGARICLADLAAAVPSIARIALRECPELPASTEARIADNRAQTYADSVMYRQALAAAAEARGWKVFWYDREAVLAAADADALDAMGAAAGRPWRANHKLAAAAALAASASRR